LCEVRGVQYSSVTNIGVRPTFQIETPSDSKLTEFVNDTVVESHLLNQDLDLYGEKIKINFYRFLRLEKKFENIEALKQAIQSDIKLTEEFFSNSLP